ncbi:hypothetical protein HG530_000118 [Fusarium avenaceum]|nr:hypothetical protein HG530_000118 [Fusarium avenaceum]
MQTINIPLNLGHFIPRIYMVDSFFAPVPDVPSARPSVFRESCVGSALEPEPDSSGVGSGSGTGSGSANVLVGRGRLRSQGKISGAGFDRAAGFSFGTSYHMFFGGLGYLAGGTKGERYIVHDELFQISNGRREMTRHGAPNLAHPGLQGVPVSQESRDHVVRFLGAAHGFHEDATPL